MPDKLEIPPDCDLRMQTRQLVRQFGVSEATIRRWKARAGLSMSPGNQRGVKPRSVAAWTAISEEDWSKGYTHVGALMGVSRQAVCQIRKRLIRDGHFPGKRTVPLKTCH